MLTFTKVNRKRSLKSITKDLCPSFPLLCNSAICCPRGLSLPPTHPCPNHSYAHTHTQMHIIFLHTGENVHICHVNRCCLDQIFSTMSLDFIFSSFRPCSEKVYQSDISKCFRFKSNKQQLD